MSMRQRNILLCVGGLLVGGAVYLLFREGAYLSRPFNGSLILTQIRNILDGTLGVRISFYLPDFMWSFSLCCGIQAICLPKGRGMYAAAAAAFACGLIWELMQWMSVLSGTGDFLDIVMYFLGSTLAITVNRRRENDEET